MIVINTATVTKLAFTGQVCIYGLSTESVRFYETFFQSGTKVVSTNVRGSCSNYHRGIRGQYHLPPVSNKIYSYVSNYV